MGAIYAHNDNDWGNGNFNQGRSVPQSARFTVAWSHGEPHGLSSKLPPAMIFMRRLPAKVVDAEVNLIEPSPRTGVRPCPAVSVEVVGGLCRVVHKDVGLVQGRVPQSDQRVIHGAHGRW
jgi:hypothetical protein